MQCPKEISVLCSLDIEPDTFLGIKSLEKRVGVAVYIVFFCTYSFTFQLPDKPWSQVTPLLAPPVLAFNFYRA